ncbi:unnamed protein product, partial [Rotaria sp. Silwood2]
VRCNVLYLGTAIPSPDKHGIDSLQEPLSRRYPTDGNESVRGIEAWLSVDASGLQIQFVSDPSIMIYYPIRSLVYCASVRFVTRTTTGDKIRNGGRFVPLDSPEAHHIGNIRNPPLFAITFQRTRHLPVDECHCFVLKSKQVALDLVQACYDAYETTDSRQDCSKVPLYFKINHDGSNIQETDDEIRIVPALDAEKTIDYQINNKCAGFFYTTDQVSLCSWQIWEHPKYDSDRPSSRQSLRSVSSVSSYRSTHQHRRTTIPSSPSIQLSLSEFQSKSRNNSIKESLEPAAIDPFAPDPNVIRVERIKDANTGQDIFIRFLRNTLETSKQSSLNQKPPYDFHIEFKNDYQLEGEISNEMKHLIIDDEHVKKSTTIDEEHFENLGISDYENFEKSATTNDEHIKSPTTTDDKHSPEPVTINDENVKNPATTDDEYFKKSPTINEEHFENPGIIYYENFEKSATTYDKYIKSPTTTDDKHSPEPVTIYDESVKNPATTDDEYFKKSATMDDEHFRKSGTSDYGHLEKSATADDERSKKRITIDKKHIKKPATTDDEHSKKPTIINDRHYKKSTRIDDDYVKKSSTIDDRHLKKPSKIDDKHSRKSRISDYGHFEKPATTDDVYVKKTSTIDDKHFKKSARIHDNHFKKRITTGDKHFKKPSRIDDEHSEKLGISDYRHFKKSTTIDYNKPQFVITDHKRKKSKRRHKKHNHHNYVVIEEYFEGHHKKKDSHTTHKKHRHNHGEIINLSLMPLIQPQSATGVFSTTYPHETIQPYERTYSYDRMPSYELRSPYETPFTFHTLPLSHESSFINNPSPYWFYTM